MSDYLDRYSQPWHGRKPHPYRNGEFDGDLAELLRITRHWYHCDVRSEVAARLFGAEETETRIEQWATANRLKVSFVETLSVWRFWW